MDLQSLNSLISSANCLSLDIPDSVYRDSIGIAQSDLKLIKSKSLYHYRYARESRKETEALILGRAIHKAVFEWDSFADDYVVLDKEVNLRTKEGRAQRDELAKTHTVLKPDQMTLIKKVVESIRRRPEISELIDGCEFERSHFVRHNERLVLKARTDGYNPKKNTIIDLKTTLDASPNSFIRDIFKYGYHFQDAFYIDVIEKLTSGTPNFRIIALEKNYPFEACTYELSPKSVAIGRKQYQVELEKLDKALREDKWPSYGPFNYVKPPAWLENIAFADV